MFRNYARILTFGLSLLAGAPNAALADWQYTAGAGPSKFLSYNSGTTPAGTSNCAASNVDCMAYIPVDSDGARWFTSGKPAIVTGAGGTFPITAASLPLPALAATSTLQTTINNTLGTPFQAGGSIGNTTFGATQGNAGSNAQAWWTRIGDATNGPAAVKAASTAVATTDTALSVQINPNTPAVAMKIASAQVASGAYAAGSLAAGALATGAGVDGWDLTQGAKADAVCTVPTSATACSVIAVLKGIANAIAPGSGGTSSNFAATFPSAGTAIGAKNGANMVFLAADGSNALSVNLLNFNGTAISSSNPVPVVGTGILDASTFTLGTTSGSGVLGLVTTAATTGLTNNDMYYLSLTTARALRSDNYSWAGTALGAPSNFGTTPGAVAVPGVNAAILTSLYAGATGAAPPASAAYIGANGSGATGGLQRGMITCDQHAFKDDTTALETVVAGTAARKTYICGYLIATGGTATNVGLTSGTGTNCVSTSVAVTPVYQLLANDRVGVMSPFWTGLVSLAAADNLCVSGSAANSRQVDVWYAIL